MGSIQTAEALLPDSHPFDRLPCVCYVISGRIERLYSPEEEQFLAWHSFSLPARSRFLSKRAGWRALFSESFSSARYSPGR